MVIGICQIELHLPENHSLKGKRHVLASLKAQLRQRFNISVAETDSNDLWQRITLGIATVSNDQQQADEVLAKAVNFVEDLHLAVLVDYHTEIIHLNAENPTY